MPPQKVLFDASPMLDIQKTGVGYYVTNLMEAVQDLYGKELELTGYYFNFLNRHPSKNKYEGMNLYKIWLVPGKFISVCRRLGFQPWLELFVNKRSDTVLFTNYVSLPQIRKTTRTVLIIYDLGFLDVPEYTQTKNLNFLKKFCPPSIRQADTIVTISDFTAKRLRHYFPELKSDIVVTPIPPMGEPTKNSSISENLLSKGVAKGKYILFFGTIEPRKNLVNLINAYSLLDQKIQAEFSLVLAGGKGWKDEEILETIDSAKSEGLNIITTGYVSDEEKASLYTNAACFALPSHYEGFGMPVLEAMQYDIPVAISDIEVFHEVADNAATYFNKDDPKDISNKLSLLLGDKKLSASMVAKGKLQLKKFSWKDNAAKVYKALT